jgi:hypothetical protein
MANSYNNSNAELAPFLRELADSIESRELPKDQLKYIGEFFMSYKFHEKRNGWKEEVEEELGEMDVVKFLTLGWYIYKLILDEGIVPDGDQSNQSDQSDQSDQRDQSNQSNQSDQSDQSDQRDQSNQSDQSDQRDQSNQNI